MAKKDYPRLANDSNPVLRKFCEEITRIREEDIKDFANLENIFMRGRKVGKVPTGSSDITGSRVGDFNYDTSYLYICVDNSGTATWRRVAIGSW